MTKVKRLVFKFRRLHLDGQMIDAKPIVKLGA
jgi:hypothetical protein